MLLDKNGKLFGKISLIDVAILLFLVFAIGAGAIHVQKNQAPDSYLTVTVIVNDVSEDIANTLSAYTGEYTDAQGSVIGTSVSAHAEQEVTWELPTESPTDTESITPEATETPTEPANVELSESSDKTATEAPALVAIPIPDSFDVTIFLSCPGKEDTDFFRLSNGKPIAVGDLLILTGGETRIQVTVSDVSLQVTN